ncbi:MAG: hypothetical protein LBV36_06325 [Chromatiales bacterium]|nr:hypothetical protein [Chromatiales bacterium]
MPGHFFETVGAQPLRVSNKVPRHCLVTDVRVLGFTAFSPTYDWPRSVVVGDNAQPFGVCSSLCLQVTVRHL